MRKQKSSKHKKVPPVRRKDIQLAVLRVVGYLAISLSAVVIWLSLENLKTSVAGLEGPYDPVAVSSRTLGQTRLLNSLRDSGSHPEEAQGISIALRQVINLKKLWPKDRYEVVRSTAGAFQHLTLRHGLKRYVVSQRDGRYRARAWDVPILTRHRQISGLLKDNLWVSLESQGVPPAVIVEYADIFRWTVDFLTEPRAGDRYSVVWQERETYDGVMLGRGIEAALYDGRVPGRHVGIRFSDDYYDEKGESLQRMFLRAPLNFRRISSTFSRHRYHPILRRYRPHHGTDYSAPRGTPVIAVGAGTVVYAQYHGGHGKAVKIRHNSTYSTISGHLSRYAPGIRNGKKVRQGQVIGFVGATGIATGPHLHFELLQNEKPVNFLGLKLRIARSIGHRHKKEFGEKRDLMISALKEPARADVAAAK